MSQNIFEELQGKKQKLLSLARKAADFGWIPEHKSPSANPTDNKGSEAISYDEIVEKLEKDTLTIGVIGQMKCGKSTFLNSFVFENDILPAATTPMTAALSVITYGEKERIVAEFYTADEWAEQKMQASRSLDEANNALEESKIKAAKELVSKSSKLGDSLEKLLGQTQEDSFSNLIEYVGADGQYVAITKSVTIYYPKEYLRGVEIVDTPGFNDPIVSREERTKEFLRKADVVLMMLGLSMRQTETLYLRTCGNAASERYWSASTNMTFRIAAKRILKTKNKSRITSRRKLTKPAESAMIALW